MNKIMFRLSSLLIIAASMSFEAAAQLATLLHDPPQLIFRRNAAVLADAPAESRDSLLLTGFVGRGFHSRVVVEAAPRPKFVRSENVETAVVELVTEAIPEEFSLEPNYPNPFNPATTLAYGLPQRSYVLLAIYDLVGRQVATLVDREEPPGWHSAVWDASRFASGMYISVLRVTGLETPETRFDQRGKMLLVK